MEVKIQSEGRISVLRVTDGLTLERFTIQDEATVVLNAQDFIELTPAPDYAARQQYSFNFKE